MPEGLKRFVQKDAILKELGEAAGGNPLRGGLRV